MKEKEQKLIRNLQERVKECALFNEVKKTADDGADELTYMTFEDDFTNLDDFSPPIQDILKHLFEFYKSGETDLEKFFQFNEEKIASLELEQSISKKELSIPRENQKIKIPMAVYGLEQIQEIDDIKCYCECSLKEISVLLYEREVNMIIKNILVKKALTSKTITMRGSNQSKYYLVEEINIADELGQWRFHPFFDMMDIYLKRSGGKKFPSKWKISPGFKFEGMKICCLNSNEIDQEDKDASQNGLDISLEDFIKEIVKKYEKDENEVNNWVSIIRGQGVDAVEELLQWTQSDLNELKAIPKQIRIILYNELNKFKFRGTSDAEKKNFTKAKRAAIIHRIKRYFYSLAGRSEELGYIDQQVVELAFEDVRSYYEGESLLEELKMFYMGYTVPITKGGNVILERGMILYGPPGTGKTTLTDDLPLKLGLTPISHSLSASEVNRSLVGQTEKLLLDLCNRARKMPHLLCCVSIDEIDSLTPKRDDKASQHKTDGITVLLSVIGGIKDVPNLIILTSTNRLNQIDDAIKRRLSGQYFVGRPPPKARRNMIRKINSEEIQLDNGSTISKIMNESEIEETVKMTTNFSGAAIKKLISELSVYYRTEKKKFGGCLNLNEIAKYTTLASKKFSIKLGTYSLPELFQKKIQMQEAGKFNEVSVKWTKKEKKGQKVKLGTLLPKLLAIALGEESKYELNPPEYEHAFTGRVILNLTDLQTAKIEYQLDKELQLLIEEHKTTSSTINEFLPRFADLVEERNIDYIQLFNMDFLLDNNAFDEGKVMENINEKLQELGAYDKSLLIIDMDSLCGVNISQSKSNMGPSESYSFTNNKLFSFVIDTARTKPYIDKKKEVWIVLACKHPYLLKCVVESLNWKKTLEQIRKDQEQEEESTKEKLCAQCKQPYVEADNKVGCCSYHNGFVFESGVPAEDWVPLEDEDEINFLKCDPKCNEKGVKYICCLENLGSQGCIKRKHSENEIDRENYTSRFEKLKANRSTH